jgi:four helix bundle protein
MNYEEWQKEIPATITDDPLWKMSVYRYALFIGDLGWNDVTRLQGDRRTYSVSDQLYRSLGSISANIAKGYSRGSNKERAHFYEYSLGSARESRDWYHKSRYILGEKVVGHRISLQVQIIKLLLTMVPEERGKSLHEESAVYEVNDDIQLESLLRNAPME